MVTENNFSKSSCRNPDNRKNPENRNRIGNYGQLEKRIKRDWSKSIGGGGPEQRGGGS